MKQIIALIVSPLIFIFAIFLGCMTFIVCGLYLITMLFFSNDTETNEFGSYCLLEKDLKQTNFHEVFDDSSKVGLLTEYKDVIIQTSNDKGLDPIFVGAVSLL